MKPLVLRLVFAVATIICAITGASDTALACKCSNPFRGDNAWDRAKAESEGSSTVFEGTAEHIEMRWDLLTAKVGDLISFNTEGSNSEEPRMVITFRVDRAYKGDLGSEVQITTGMGGGDCGSIFAPGLTYLIYAQAIRPGELSVYTCSPGGWIGNPEIETELRYLRNERPIPSDLTLKPRGPLVAQEAVERAQRDLAEQTKRYAAVTGSICGTVVPEKPKEMKSGQVSFLSTKGYSPFAQPTAYTTQDGAFCSPRLAPGKYYLTFLGFSGDGLTSATYYPGVSDRLSAMTIDVSAGQTQSAIIFKAPSKKSYSVRGFISTDDKSQLVGQAVYVALMNEDGFPSALPYSTTVDFQGSFPLPKVKYFHIEDVLPGRYIAFVSGLGPDWSTRKFVVTVTTHMKFISLELVHKK